MSAHLPIRLRPGAVLLLVAAVFLLSAGLGMVGPLYNETDGQYAGAAKVMADGGSWLVPENNGMPRVQKPPLLYWLAAGSMRLFGIHEFAVRLPGALALALTVWATVLIGGQLMDRTRGLMAGVVVATSLGSYTLGRIVMPEPILTACVSWSVVALLRIGEAETARAERAWFLVFWLAASLAAFSKGPHGLLYPVAAAGVAALFDPTARRAFFRVARWPGVVLALLINVPWYLYLEFRFPGWLHALLFDEYAGHLVGNDAPVGGREDVPPWQFLLLHLAWFFPWSLAALLGLGARIRRDRDIRSGKPSITWGWWVVGAWGGVVLSSVLLLGQRQDYYAMSMWPVVALLLALGWSGLWSRWNLVALLLLGVGLVVAAMIATGGIDAGTTADRSTAWNTFSRIGDLWSAVDRWALWAGVGLLLVGTVGLGLVRGSGFRGFALYAVAAVWLGVCAVGATASVAPYFSLAGAQRQLLDEPPQALIVYDGGLDTGSSLLFYLDRPFAILEATGRKDVPGFAYRPDRFITPSALRDRWNSDEPVLLITEDQAVARWNEALGSSASVAWREGTQVALRNRGPTYRD